VELISGLHFEVTRRDTAMRMGFVDLNRRPLKSHALTELVRPTGDIFKAQAGLVYNYAELRADRQTEILTQMPNQAAYWGAVIQLQAFRYKWALELVALALLMASDIEMRFKHAFACPRPAELSPQIQSMIPSPGHGSWPSGHATEAYVVATVLLGLLQAAKGDSAKYAEQLERQAARIAVNRTVAGVHYPVDSAVGKLLGTSLGEFLIARCTGRKLHERVFNGPKFKGPRDAPLDFDPRVPLDGTVGDYYEVKKPSVSIAASPLLNFMWTKAVKEFLPLK
jgi:membrane-associated phospholipid phosphatase